MKKNKFKVGERVALVSQLGDSEFKVKATVEQVELKEGSYKYTILGDEPFFQGKTIHGAFAMQKVQRVSGVPERVLLREDE
jgi:hypothetical protein